MLSDFTGLMLVAQQYKPQSRYLLVFDDREREARQLTF